MKIQDSLYYQDYSYVIKVGRSIGAGEIVLKNNAQWPVLFYRSSKHWLTSNNKLEGLQVLILVLIMMAWR